MKNTRIVSAILAVALSVCLVSGCNLKKDKTPWQDEAKTLVAEKMDDTNVGKFVIDGVTYDFPMAVKDLTDNGWSFSSDSVGTTNVSAHAWHPSYVTLKNADNKSIDIGVYNNSDEASTIADSTVGEVSISNLRGNAMISGGIDFYGTTFAANGDLGDCAAEGFELALDEIAGNGNVFTKEFVGSNDKNCTATFYFKEYNGNIVLGEVKYECSFSISYTDGSTAMILAVINNDPSQITALDSTMDGQAFVDETRQYLAEDFVYSLGFDFDTLTEEQYARTYEIMNTIYAQTQFSVEDKGYNTLIVFNAPSNLTDVLDVAIQAAAESYEGDLDTALDDPEFLTLVLNSFNADDLTMMPGKSILATSGNYSEDLYSAMYGMLGFDIG
ncbi:MAG: hypothetical protein J6U54_04195 [Clostridiales bacterium]|nr:hypothetical protein [Clostridiales bacterium]